MPPIGIFNEKKRLRIRDMAAMRAVNTIALAREPDIPDPGDELLPVSDGRTADTTMISLLIVMKIFQKGPGKIRAPSICQN
jgi:hypothetical protein